MRAGAPREIVEESCLACARLCERTREPRATSWFFFCAAIFRNLTGDVDGTLSLLDRTQELGARYPGPALSYDLRWIAYARVNALYRAGRFSELPGLVPAELEHVVACEDHTLMAPLAMMVLSSLLAADRPAFAVRVRDETEARFTGVPTTFSEQIWLTYESRPALYRGEAAQAWLGQVGRRRRFMWSFVGRFIDPGALEEVGAALAAAAAEQARSPAECGALRKTARRLARRALYLTRSPTAAAILACLRGDRDDACIALYALCCDPAVTPCQRAFTQRALGALLGGQAGQALIAEVDAALRKGGVVDPAGFVAAMAPGLTLPKQHVAEPA